VKILNEDTAEFLKKEERDSLVEELRSTAIQYCMMSKHGNGVTMVAKQKAKAIQNCINDVDLCYRAASLLTLTRNSVKYGILDCENLQE
jgi:hypothetical protein